MRFTQCATSFSSVLITMDNDEVEPVWNGPLIPPNIWGLHSVQSAPYPWHCLRDDVYKVCSWPLISERWSLPVYNQSLWRIRFSQCTMSLPSVQWAPHPWLCLRDEVHPICNQPHLQPLLLPEMKLTSVQPVSHPSWEISFFQCAILTP